MFIFSQTGIRKLVFNSSGFRKELESNIEQLMLEAAGEWLRAVITAVEGSFPVQTGTAKGSLIPLNRFLKSQGIDIANFHVVPKIQQKGRGPEVGARLGKQPPFIHKFKNQFGVFRYQFVWGTDVEHYILNDFFQVAGGAGLFRRTPWQTRLAGNIAFTAYVNQNINQRVPGLTKYIGFEN